MLFPKWSGVLLALSILTNPLYAEEPEGISKLSNSLELVLGGGTHRYAEDIDPHPGTASLGTSLFGYHTTDRSMIGVRYSLSQYTTQRVVTVTGRSGDTLTLSSGEKESWKVFSAFVLYRRSFRIRKPVQPYFDIGLGAASNYAGYEGGRKFASSISVGANWRFASHWVVAFEARGIAINTSLEGHTAGPVPDGPLTVVETTLGIGWTLN